MSHLNKFDAANAIWHVEGNVDFDVGFCIDQLDDRYRSFVQNLKRSINIGEIDRKMASKMRLKKIILSSFEILFSIFFSFLILLAKKYIYEALIIYEIMNDIIY